MDNSPILEILNNDDWGEYRPVLDELKSRRYFDLLMDAYEKLDIGALYDSAIHGVGHIERTILHGGFICMREGLDAGQTALVLDACSYHDVGRENDNVDYDHGYRSSLQLEALTGRGGDELNIIKAAVTAHSRNDGDMEAILASYDIENRPLSMTVSELLKDADGLDRVRINDLNPRFLRRESSRGQAGFAVWLFKRYQQLMGLSPTPMYPRSVMSMLRQAGEELSGEELWNMDAFRAAVSRSYCSLSAEGTPPKLRGSLMKYFKLEPVNT
ncbi:MAG: hypothetical protein IJ072_07030 [Oscillospiraceae bacterium]|nr:hypothetical protein [Oscillospiraceae bacterium]